MSDSPTWQVLVAEDDELVSQLLKEILEKKGYSVDVASDGVSALRLAERHSYGAIIIDVVLNGPREGKELYLALGKRDAALLERVLFITADIISADTTAFLKETRRPFLYKPFTVPELIGQVQLILNQPPT